MAPLDLSRVAVFLDYDGTISTRDTGVALLERFAHPGWREIDEEYVRGGIGSRVCLLDEWDLLPKDEAQLRAAAAEIPLDPGLEALVGGLRAAGAEIAVVSDGFGFYVHERLAHLGLPVVTNAVDWTTGTLEFPNADRCCACSSCGTCKQAPIKDAKHRGRTTVLVGDGASDQKAALLVDVLFAKEGLARWCDRAGVPYHAFTTLADVRVALLGP
jgi:2-hydroxy-3-keto-5-methylthiopentenyl-1-phosphate phosphatase